MPALHHAIKGLGGVVKLRIIACAALAVLTLGGCHKKADAPAPDAMDDWTLFGSKHGRFVGLGIYAPQTPWTKMVDAAQAGANPAAAKPLDDQAIFVVVDSQTGELRACGDLTGYCIGMNPWRKPLTPAQIAPIMLSEHVKPPEVAITETPAPKHRSAAKPDQDDAPASGAPATQ
jgi:hypothetical protein